MVLNFDQLYLSHIQYYSMLLVGLTSHQCPKQKLLSHRDQIWRSQKVQKMSEAAEVKHTVSIRTKKMIKFARIEQWTEKMGS